MENKTNERVPMAILSCFLIAFILQGILKINGVFVFEKALDWKIFELIDKYKFIQIVYYSFISFISVYCLSISFMSKCYSKKWYHYVVMILGCICVTLLKYYTEYVVGLEFVYDAILYIIIPLFVNFTTDTKNLIFKDKSLNAIVITITFQILGYLFYLGLCCWSTMLNSIILINQAFLPASTMFLIFFEVYLGMGLFMITLNNIIKIKGEK